MSNINLDAAKELRLTGIKKCWKRAGQVEIELYWLHDWILALAIFVRQSYKKYDNEKVIENMKIRQNINPKYVTSFFIQLHGSIQY